jgi:hypothetical protein
MLWMECRGVGWEGIVSAGVELVIRRGNDVGEGKKGVTPIGA